MGDIGRLRPHPSGEEKVQQWEVPVIVFDAKTGKKYKVVAVYEDEGFLCIDINQESEEA